MGSSSAFLRGVCRLTSHELKGLRRLSPVPGDSSYTSVSRRLGTFLWAFSAVVTNFPAVAASSGTGRIRKIRLFERVWRLVHRCSQSSIELLPLPSWFASRSRELSPHRLSSVGFCAPTVASISDSCSVSPPGSDISTPKAPCDHRSGKHPGNDVRIAVQTS